MMQNVYRQLEELTGRYVDQVVRDEWAGHAHQFLCECAVGLSCYWSR